MTPFTNDVIEKQMKKNEKQGENSLKTGVNGFPKNLNGILRHAINEWRPN